MLDSDITKTGTEGISNKTIVYFFENETDND